MGGEPHQARVAADVLRHHGRGAQGAFSKSPGVAEAILPEARSSADGFSRTNYPRVEQQYRAEQRGAGKLEQSCSKQGSEVESR